MSVWRKLAEQLVELRFQKCDRFPVRPAIQRQHPDIHLRHRIKLHSDIAKDHGLSTWVQLHLAKNLGLYGGYTHSTQYSLGTISFGVSLYLGKAIRSLGI